MLLLTGQCQKMFLHNKSVNFKDKRKSTTAETRLGVCTDDLVAVAKPPGMHTSKMFIWLICCANTPNRTNSLQDKVWYFFFFSTSSQTFYCQNEMHSTKIRLST